MTIDGLRWVSHWRVNNGKTDTYVIPFITIHPVNIVYHGEHKFKYGQYGIHLGQQELLRETPTHNTPKSVVVFDESSGKHVKVLLKEKV